MGGYPEGMSSSDLCYVEGHIYADATSADPSERRAAAAGRAPSTCARCGEPNYELRGALAAESRRLGRKATPADLQARADASFDAQLGAEDVKE